MFFRCNPEMYSFRVVMNKNEYEKKFNLLSIEFMSQYISIAISGYPDHCCGSMSMLKKNFQVFTQRLSFIFCTKNGVYINQRKESQPF